MVFGHTRLYWSNKRNHEVTTKTRKLFQEMDWSERKVVGYKNSEVSGRVYSNWNYKNCSKNQNCTDGLFTPSSHKETVQ